MSQTANRFERALSASRWLLVPIYLGLVGALVLLALGGFKELWRLASRIGTLTANDVILGTLTLIDISLVGNLVVLVICSGYENFVARFSDELAENRPVTVDFSEMKLSLFASIVAISGIHLLKAFMDPSLVTGEQIRWMILTHLVFVVSTVTLALTDWIIGKAKQAKH